jgi:glycosyltransferase involved in cell wall biosynthesis
MNPFGALKVWQKILAVEPKVVHLFNGEGYPWAVLWSLLAEAHKVPFLVTVHDPEPHPKNLYETASARLRYWVLKRAAGVHVHGENLVPLLARYGVPKERVQVIPHGSLASRYTKHVRPGILKEPLVLFFGRMEYYKGLDYLVEAAFILRGQFRFAIAGPGRLPRRVARAIHANPDLFELYNRYLDDHEVAHLFQRSAVCVLPYRQATQSGVPLIAAGFGVPVVATHLGALAEDVPRVGGLTVPPNDSKILAAAIQQAISRPVNYPKELEFTVLSARFVQWYRRHAIFG